MSRIVLDWNPVDVEHGPPKPMGCVEGPESHHWEMTIEEGQLCLRSGCNLCDDGLMAYSEPEDFGMDEPVQVVMKFHVDRGYDGDTWTYWEIRPTGWVIKS